MPELYQNNVATADYSSVKDHCRDDRPQKYDEEAVSDFDIVRGKYSMIENNLDILPEEIQEALAFVFLKDKKTNGDKVFLCKVKKSIEDSQGFKGQIHGILDKVRKRSDGKVLPLTRFPTLNGELKAIQKEQKDREDSLPVLIPKDRTEENDPFLRVFHEARAEFAKKLTDI